MSPERSEGSDELACATDAGGANLLVRFRAQRTRWEWHPSKVSLMAECWRLIAVCYRFTFTL